MVRKVGRPNREKRIHYVASAVAILLAATTISAALTEEAFAGGGAGRTSGIIRECNEAVCDASMKGSSFIPETLKIRPGATVVWTNTEMMLHTVTNGDSRDNIGLLFDSGFQSPMSDHDTFEHKFDTKGTFNYFCQIHPKMIGQILVTGEPLQQFSRLTFMMIMAAGVLGTFAAVATIRLKRK